MKLLTIIMAVMTLSSANVMSATHTKGYQSLRDVKMRPAFQPRFEHGIDQLRSREMRYQEKLPLQLAQSIHKISLQKYR
jgi:hypothetical protein